MGDGDGWVICTGGHRHWGRFGAAGLLLTRPGHVVLQQRSVYSHEGGTWALPGGARDSHEDPVQTALREAAEEGGIASGEVEPLGLFRDDHGGWSYTTVVAHAIGDVRPTATSWESDDVRWWEVGAVDALPLHRGFAAAWPRVRSPIGRLRIVVDAANVVGARPDGWWRDRLGANERLRERLDGLARNGVPAGDPVLGRARPDAENALTRRLPEIELVVEGAARPVADPPADERDSGPRWWARRVSAIAAPRSGDDTIVALAERAATDEDTDVIVVTADRGLRTRLPTRAAAVGPAWLLDQLDGLSAEPERDR
jgi:8-oxo-dGTP pyrophosphatase MutT (NUDIX family)